MLFDDFQKRKNRFLVKRVIPLLPALSYTDEIASFKPFQRMRNRALVKAQTRSDSGDIQTSVLLQQLQNLKPFFVCKSAEKEVVRIASDHNMIQPVTGN